MSFSPIAIVGRSCLLPSVQNPAELWDAVSKGKDLLSDCPPNRWRVPLEDICVRDGTSIQDRSFSSRGGYVRNFEKIWNPEGFAVDASALEGLDLSVLWALHCAREALDYF